MNPRVELLKFLAGQTATSGILVRIENGVGLVSTSQGIKRCSVATQTQLGSGDTVSIRNNTIVSKLIPDDQINTFEV